MNMYFYYLFILNVHHLQSSFFCNLSVKTAVSSLSRLSSYFVLHHLYCRLFPSKNRGPMYLLPFFNFLIKMFWFSFVWVSFFFLVTIWGCSSLQTWICSVICTVVKKRFYRTRWSPVKNELPPYCFYRG